MGKKVEKTCCVVRTCPTCRRTILQEGDNLTGPTDVGVCTDLLYTHENDALTLCPIYVIVAAGALV